MLFRLDNSGENVSMFILVLVNENHTTRRSYRVVVDVDLYSLLAYTIYVEPNRQSHHGHRYFHIAHELILLFRQVETLVKREKRVLLRETWGGHLKRQT